MIDRIEQWLKDMGLETKRFVYPFDCIEVIVKNAHQKEAWVVIYEDRISIGHKDNFQMNMEEPFILLYSDKDGPLLDFDEITNIIMLTIEFASRAKFDWR